MCEPLLSIIGAIALAIAAVVVICGFLWTIGRIAGEALPPANTSAGGDDR